MWRTMVGEVGGGRGRLDRQPDRGGGRAVRKRGRREARARPTATSAPLNSHRGKALSPPGSDHWGKQRAERRASWVTVWRPRKQHLGRAQTQEEARGHRQQAPLRRGEEESGRNEGGTVGTLRRKEEGEKGQAQWPKRRRVAGGCRQEAGDLTGVVPGVAASPPVPRPVCASEGRHGAPHHGPQHPLELLPLLPADCGCGSS